MSNMRSKREVAKRIRRTLRKIAKICIVVLSAYMVLPLAVQYKQYVPGGTSLGLQAVSRSKYRWLNDTISHRVDNRKSTTTESQVDVNAVKPSTYTGLNDNMSHRVDNKTTATSHSQIVHFEEYEERFQQYQNVCAAREGVKAVVRLGFYYRNQTTNQSLGYCIVPKAASTFWTKIFQFLNRQNESRHVVKNPFDQTRFTTYYFSLSGSSQIINNSPKLKDAYRFMFVRDPYSRLMSAYVDKFILLQLMSWRDFGKRIAGARGLETEGEPVCLEEDVSFSEFIENCVLIDERLNAHWWHLYKLCDPCSYQPHFIGKQETFFDDAMFVLKHARLDHLIANYTYNTYVGDEIRYMTDYMFRYHHIDRYIAKCYNMTRLLSLIWKAYQYNTYLPADMVFPQHEFTEQLKDVTALDKVINIATEIIVQKHAEWGISRSQRSKQKRNMLVKLFASLSRETMEKIALFYSDDFNLFSYEQYPKDLFPWKLA